MTVPAAQVLADLICMVENAGPNVYINRDQLDALRSTGILMPKYNTHNTKYGVTFSMRRSHLKGKIESLIAKIVAESLES